ncbi:MAG: hypothetical protein MRZ79_17400 [Bacteroidia bacterium]|nr:hypothetical protein [Bacteroidia bacterium]
MSYTNPFILLELPNPFSPSMITNSFLRMEKKRLMAEFELEEATVIEVGGKEMDKDRVLALFQELEDDSIRQYHLRVFMESGLMEFLEDASLEYFYNGGISKLPAHSDDFLTFIGSHFSTSFNARLHHAYRQKDWEEVELMCKYPLPLSAVHKALCYQDSYRQLHADVTELENYAEDLAAGKIPDGKIQEMGDELMIDTLNHLPEYFRSSRDKYALALESVAISVYNDHQRIHLSVFLLRQALKLNTSAETKDRLQDLLNQILAQNPIAGPIGQITGGFGKKKKKTNWRAWAAAVVILTTILRFLLG